MSGDRLSGEARKKILFMALGFFFVFGFSNVNYFLPVYYSQTGMKSTDSAGWLVAVFYIVAVASRPFLANAVEMFGFRRIFITAGVLSVLSSAGVALSGINFWPAFASRALLGFASSLFQIGLATYQAIAFKEEERGRAFSLIMAGGLAPMMTLVPFADWLLSRRLNVLFIIFPVLICLAAALLTPSIPGLDRAPLHRGKPSSAPAGNGKKSIFDGLGDCLRLKTFRMALLSMFLFSVADASAAFMAPMTRHYGIMASFFLSSNAVMGVLVRLSCGRLLDRVPRNMLAPAAILITSGTLFLATINPTETSLISLGLIFGIGMGFGFPLHLALISDSVPHHLQPQSVSISWFVMGLNFAMVPLIMGWIGNIAGPVLALRIITGLVVAGALIECPSMLKKTQKAQ